MLLIRIGTRIPPPVESKIMLTNLYAPVASCGKYENSFEPGMERIKAKCQTVPTELTKTPWKHRPLKKVYPSMHMYFTSSVWNKTNSANAFVSNHALGSTTTSGTTLRRAIVSLSLMQSNWVYTSVRMLCPRDTMFVITSVRTFWPFFR